MRYYSFMLLFTVLLVTGCNKPNNAPTENSTDSTLSKGIPVLEDEMNIQNADPNSGAFNEVGNTRDMVSPADNKPKSRLTNLKQRYKNLLLFHASDTMKINKSYLATLVLGKDQVLGELKNDLIGNTNADSVELKEDTTLELGSKMKARLIDMSGAENKGFLIELIGGEEAAIQSITDKRKKVTWQWKLTPQTKGQQELRLSINVIEKDGEIVNFPARNIPIMIFAEKTSIISSIGAFLEKYAQLLIASILIPIFIAWFTTRMRYKIENKNKLAASAEINPQNSMYGTDQNNPQKTEPTGATESAKSST